ncbi:hypothetical protein BASA81_017559 [Batrachochytrium salamandrivorans]|nr:hypothetical protein BASA81_017559 [Batrachochytrium salamandrivorans]
MTSKDDDGEEDAIPTYNTCCKRLRNELKVENLWYTGDYPRTHGQLNYVMAFGTGGTAGLCCRSRPKTIFVPIQPWKWIIWRTFVFAYLVGVFIYSLATDWDGDGSWFYYLTHWQTLIFALYGTVSLLTCILLRRHYPQELFATFDESNQLLTQNHSPYRMPTYAKLTWILHGLAMSCGIWVTVMFWSAVFTMRDTSSPSIWLNFIEHFSTCMLVLIDFYLSAFPWLLFQSVWSTMFISIYTVWTGIHYALGLGNKFDSGRYIYEAIDWAKPLQTFFIIMVLIFVALPLVNLIVWLASSEHMYWRWSPRRLVPWMRPKISTALVVLPDQSAQGGLAMEDVEAK